MKKTEKNTNTNNIVEKLNKVSKLNKITMLLIIVLYIVIVAVVGTIIHREPEYKVEENAEEIFNEDANFSTFIMTKLTAVDHDHEDGEETDHSHVETAYYVYTLGDTKDGKTQSNVKYDLTVKTTEGNYVYFDRITANIPYSNTKRNTITVKNQNSSTPSTTYSYNNTLLKTEGISALYSKVNYIQTVSDETETEVSQTKTQTYSYVTNVLTLTTKEALSAVSESTILDYINIEFYLTSKESTLYRYAISVRELDLESPYKLNFQSFVETGDGEIVPLCGLYNYADDDTKFTTVNKYSSSENIISNSLEVKNVYLKVRLYISANEYKETLIVYNYQDLINDLRN